VGPAPPERVAANTANRSPSAPVADRITVADHATDQLS
jgi:hypothetical protein